MNISVRTNFRDYFDLMKILPKEVKKHVRREMKRAADVIVVKAKELAPFKTGHLQSRIRSRQASWSKDGLTYEIISDTVKGNSSAGPYPSFQELGTVHNKKHPYLGPAFMQSLPECQRIISAAISDALWAMHVTDTSHSVDRSGSDFRSGYYRAMLDSMGRWQD